jgi:hypothetical protein
MNANHAIVDLASIAVPLASDASSLFAAFRRARLVHATDRFIVGMFPDNDLLAAIPQFLFIPLNRFEKPLQCPRRSFALQGDGLGRFSVQIG